MLRILFDSLIVGVLLALLVAAGFLVTNQKEQHDRSIKMMAIIADRLVSTNKKPRPVILTSYDNAGKLRTVRLDGKGRVVVSP